MTFPAALKTDRESRVGRGRFALPAALAAVLLTSAPAVAVAIGVLMTQERKACPVWWALPALLCSALMPDSTLALLSIFPVLFWPALFTREGALFPALSSVLAVALVWHAGAVVPIGCAAGLAALVLLVLGRSVFWGISPGDVGLVRPAILATLLIAAQDEGMGTGARIALESLLLDLTLITLSVPALRLMPVLVTLRLPFPPLPGFLVLWLGIHAALGLAAGVQGWSVIGVLVALLIGLISLFDVLTVGRRPDTGVLPIGPDGAVCGVILGALLLPVAVFGVFSPVLHHVEGEWVWPFWSLGGGDGAHLKVPALMLILSVMWLFFVKSWRTERGLEKAIANLLLPGTQTGRSETGLFEEPPALPWIMRRLIVGGRIRLQALATLKSGQMPDMRQMAVGLWLVLLALVLVVLGLTA
ncbi:MAG: hypothetical protein ABF812_00900 [Gluconobacter cerinus]|uniref:hypothetical protein n=1 Tax=Gluconobacter cerinus TaxID=38307 RepID=UPI0039E78FE8